LFKKSYILIAILLLALPFTLVKALDDYQKGAILDSYKKKQYDLLFESDF
jgi:hypothetical protein